MELYASLDETEGVFLSGNGPLVSILQEALARDKVARERAAGRTIKKHVARSEVKMFIQNVHHYRDECLRDPAPPVDHVALFDEAQRAWNREQTTKFMRQKKGQARPMAEDPQNGPTGLPEERLQGVVDPCSTGNGNCRSAWQHGGSYARSEFLRPDL
jgi:hypothetical protein